MGRIKTLIRVAAIAAALALALGSLAWGEGDDHYYRNGEARENGYRNGYRDGSTRGASDRDRGHRFKFKTDDWEDSRGYEHWMGSHGEYKSAYRQGYEEGYRRAYGDYGDRRRDWRDRDWR